MKTWTHGARARHGRALHNESLAADALQRHAELKRGVLWRLAFGFTAKMVVYVTMRTIMARRDRTAALGSPIFHRSHAAVIERMLITPTPTDSDARRRF